MNGELLTALLIYLASALVIVLIMDFITRRWRSTARRYVLIWTFAVLFTPAPANDQFSLLAPACVGMVYNLLTHSLSGMARSMAPIALVLAVLSLIVSWIPVRSQPASADDYEHRD